MPARDTFNRLTIVRSCGTMVIPHLELRVGYRPLLCRRWGRVSTAKVEAQQQPGSRLAFVSTMYKEEE